MIKEPYILRKRLVWAAAKSNHHLANKTFLRGYRKHHYHKDLYEKIRMLKERLDKMDHEKYDAYRVQALKYRLEELLSLA